MTREELRAELRALTGDSIEEEVVQRVDRIISAWPEPSDTVNFEQRITALTEERDNAIRERDAERERFRKRFWEGEDDGADDAPDGEKPNMQDIGMTDNDLVNLWR